MIVAVTQYKFPNGRAVAQTTEIGDDFRPQYEVMCSRGWNLAAECQDGQVTLFIEDQPHGEDIGIEVAPNGPEVQRAIQKLLKEHCS